MVINGVSYCDLQLLGKERVSNMKLNCKYVCGIGIVLLTVLFGCLAHYFIGIGDGRYLIAFVLIGLPFAIVHGTVARFNEILKMRNDRREQYKRDQKVFAEIASALTMVGLAASLWVAYGSMDMLNIEAKYRNYSRAASRLKPLLTPAFCESKPYLRIACEQIQRTQRNLEWKILENDNVRIASAVGSIKSALDTLAAELPDEVLPIKGEILRDLESLVFPSESSRVLFSLIILSLLTVFATNSVSWKLAVATFDATVGMGQEEKQMTNGRLIVLFWTIART